MKGRRGGIHIVEAGGRGGVYQHSVAVAQALAARGERVTLHTATDAELEPGGDVVMCRCVRWHRDDATRLRGIRIALGWVGRTVPHLARAVGPGEVFHFEGEFKPVLTSPLLLVERALPGRRVVQSLHNTFARSDAHMDDALIRAGIRVTDAVVVFSRHDANQVERLGGRAVVSPLAQYTPPVDPAAVERWRDRWGAGHRPVLLFGGQIRPDKRLDLAIRASAELARDHVLAVVGEDKGDVDRCRRLAAELRVDVSWTVDYVALGDFVAALAAADVVVCPYDRASQSGVLAVTRKVGTRSVASAVGGLAELATVTAPPGDAPALARAVEEALDAPGQQDDMESGVVGAHLRAYGFEEEDGGGA
jgi:glycosyltransferase involved in cell wall biosynthesis